MVADAKFRMNPELYRMPRQFSNNSHMSYQGTLPLSLAPDHYSPVEDGSGDLDGSGGGVVCCMGSQMKTKVMSSKQMWIVMMIVVFVAFSRGILFASMLKYDECVIGDGTLLPTCEPG